MSTQPFFASTFVTCPSIVCGVPIGSICADALPDSAVRAIKLASARILMGRRLPELALLAGVFIQILKLFQVIVQVIQVFLLSPGTVLLRALLLFGLLPALLAGAARLAGTLPSFLFAILLHFAGPPPA